MSTIGSRIRDRRIELGLSADDLALKLGKNRATIYRYEGDEIENFPVSVIGPLAQVLDVSPAYLMGWSSEKNSFDSVSEKREEPASPEESERIKEFARVFGKLTADEQALIIAQIKGILSSR